MSIVELDGVSKIYHVGDAPLYALNDMSFSVDEGEFSAIMGASGSGKTTTMNMIGLLDKPSHGVCRFLQEDVMTLTPDELAYYRNQYIGFVFQSFLLLPKLTVLQNVSLPLMYRQVSAKEAEQRSRNILDQVGMSEHMQHHPYELSGGQQQRVAIARALVGRPKLILADEPTGALDSMTGQVVMDLLRKMHREQNVTILVITHDRSVAQYCDRIIQVRDGRVVDDQENVRQTAGA
jgi:putative ABC transport system ATP-binding protein